MARAAVVARSSVACARDHQRGCSLELEVACDLGSSAAVQAVENPLAILVANLVQELVGAERSDLGSGLVPEDLRHRFRELAAPHDTGRSPDTGVSNAPAMPPPPHDDDEVMLAEDRVAIVACDPDAANLVLGALQLLCSESVIKSAPCRCSTDALSPAA